MFCPNCGQKTVKESRFCTSCGTLLAEPVEVKHPLTYRTTPTGPQSFMRSVGDTLSLSITVYRENFVQFASFSLIFMLSGLVTIITGSIIVMVIPLFSPLFIFPTPVLFLAFSIVGTLFTTVGRVGIIQMTDDFLRKRENDFSITRVFHSIKDKVLNILIAQIIMGFILAAFIFMIIIVPVILLIIIFSSILHSASSFLPVLAIMMLPLALMIVILVAVYYFLAHFAFVDQLVVLENKGPLEALRLSGERTKGQKWKIIVTLYIISMIVGFVSYFGSFIFIIPLLFFTVITRSIIVFVIGILMLFLIVMSLIALVMPLQLIATTVLYEEAVEKGFTGKKVSELKKPGKMIYVGNRMHR